MADTVTGPTILQQNDNRVVIKIVNQFSNSYRLVLAFNEKNIDYIFDVGPEGGKGGGTIVAHGKPEQILDVEESHTAVYLKKEFITHENV